MRTVLPGIFLLLIILGLFACHNSAGKKLLPELSESDSAAVIFYNKKADSRFFKYTKVYEVTEMQQLLKDVNAEVVKEVPDCPTQGKIYFYKKKGAIDVVYFSGRDGCMRFYFIINGEKYFVKMSKVANGFLDTLATLAKEPVSSN